MSNLLKENKELIKEWDYLKNHNIDLDKTKEFSNKKAWWICSKCSYNWSASISNRSKGHGCPRCSGRVVSDTNNLAVVAPKLANQWHPTKNGKLTPKDVGPYSEKKVWWICKRGHEWEATVSNRYQGRNCRKCSNELRTSFPEQCIMYYLKDYFNIESRIKINNWEVDILLKDCDVAIEYDGIAYHDRLKLKKREMEKNNAIKKTGIHLIRIKESYDKEGIYNNTIFFKVDHNYTHLKDAILLLIEYLNNLLNKKIKIIVDIENDRNDIYNNYINYEKKNSFAERYPELIKIWNYEKNKNLKPEYFSYMSNKIVFWKCNICNGEWQSSIINISKGNRCPYCSGHKVLKGYNDLETINPTLAKEWNYEKNGELVPSMFTIGSNRTVWWKCQNNHEWRATIARRSKSSMCPYCSGKHKKVALHDEEWLEKYNLVKKYYEKYGNININAKYVTDNGIKLGSWIRTQRVNFKNNNLNNKRIDLLNKVGMIWESKPGAKKGKNKQPVL
jgi:rubrerythrin/CDGSH-type Zn-finger protein